MDITMVVIAVALGYFYFGAWQWQVVGVGTLMAMIIVGAMVKFFDKRLEWFSRLLYYRPGFRRYIYMDWLGISTGSSDNSVHSMVYKRNRLARVGGDDLSIWG